MRSGNITEFNYRDADRQDAKVLVGIQTRLEESRLEESRSDREVFLQKLKRDYDVQDLSENEVAVLHVRHMVGGRAKGIDDERLFRFEFPERPGALSKFLGILGNDFNISMFHYRNHGAAYGRVLVGIQIPAEDMNKFKQGLAEIGYRFWDETDNPAYQLFLC